VYKVNADDRLVDLGIFHPQRAEHDTLLVQTKTYYGFASDYNQRLYGRATAVSDIMEKLARWAERYVSVLHQARRDYLHFVETLTDEDILEFHQTLERDARTVSIRAKHDEFLDVYSAWQRTSSPEAKVRLLRILEELRYLDPMFRGPGLFKPTE